MSQVLENIDVDWSMRYLGIRLQRRERNYKILTTFIYIQLYQSRRLPPNPSLIPLQAPLSRKLMLHHRPRIPILLRNFRRLAPLLIRIMHC